MPIDVNEFQPLLTDVDRLICVANDCFIDSNKCVLITIVLDDVDWFKTKLWMLMDFLWS